MSIALVSMNSLEYQELADITWLQNKVPYCERHGFGFYRSIVLPHAKIGFEKLRVVKSAFAEGFDWVWATGCDSMVTDFTNDLSKIIDTHRSCIIATDINGINADSFLVKNDPTGRFIIDRCLELEERYDTEQHVIMDLTIEFPSMFHIVPQRTINSYNYDLYSTPEELRFDELGTQGDWQYGDLLIHWPGFMNNPEMRVKFAKAMLDQIKK